MVITTMSASGLSEASPVCSPQRTEPKRRRVSNSFWLDSACGRVEQRCGRAHRDGRWARAKGQGECGYLLTDRAQACSIRRQATAMGGDATAP